MLSRQADPAGCDLSWSIYPSNGRKKTSSPDKNMLLMNWVHKLEAKKRGLLEEKLLRCQVSPAVTGSTSLFPRFLLQWEANENSALRTRTYIYNGESETYWVKCGRNADSFQRFCGPESSFSSKFQIFFKTHSYNIVHFTTNVPVSVRASTGLDFLSFSVRIADIWQTIWVIWNKTKCTWQVGPILWT